MASPESCSELYRSRQAESSRRSVRASCTRRTRHAGSAAVMHAAVRCALYTWWDWRLERLILGTARAALYGGDCPVHWIAAVSICLSFQKNCGVAEIWGGGLKFWRGGRNLGGRPEILTGRPAPPKPLVENTASAMLLVKTAVFI